jgi:hypothetical protein
VNQLLIMRKLLLAVLLLMCVTGAMAQQVYNSSGKDNYKVKKKGGYDASKLVLGGGINFGISGGYTVLGVSPIVGYRVAKPLVAGIGVGYLYQRQIGFVDGFNKVHYDKMNIIYPNLWARCSVYKNFYISGTYEYDIISWKGDVQDFTGNFVQKKLNLTNQCLLAGVGMTQPIGGRASFYVELVYDVLQGKFSPYPPGAPTTRFGVAVGL